MLELFKRIRQRREELGMTQDELAQKLGYKSRSSINKIEKGENDIPQSKIVAFANALETSPEILMGWTNKPSPTLLPTNAIVLSDTPIPIIGSIAAGTPLLAQQNIEGYAIPADKVKADFALRVSGDSMMNVPILDGDIVFIRRQSTVENGEIAAIQIDGEATLKRFYREDSSITLVAENPKYKPMVYTTENCDDFRILGKAVAYQHSFEMDVKEK